MSRPTKTVALPISKFSIEIATYLTWGEKEDIRSLMLEGVKFNQGGSDGLSAKNMSEAKYKAFEVIIKKVAGEDGAEVPYTKEWIRDLPASDVELLYSAIDDLDKKDEKKD